MLCLVLQSSLAAQSCVPRDALLPFPRFGHSWRCLHSSAAVKRPIPVAVRGHCRIVVGGVKFIYFPAHGGLHEEGAIRTGTPDSPQLLVKTSLALRLDPRLGGNHDHDAHRLRLCSETVRVEFVRRLAETIVDAVERHAEEMLDLRGWQPPDPARRLVGADDTRQVRERDAAAAAFHVADGGFARSADRTAGHGPNMWQALSAEAKATSRARRSTLLNCHPDSKFATYIADEKWPRRGPPSPCEHRTRNENLPLSPC
jgi:hypothetical protein